MYKTLISKNPETAWLLKKLQLNIILTENEWKREKDVEREEAKKDFSKVRYGKNPFFELIETRLEQKSIWLKFDLSGTQFGWKSIWVKLDYSARLD